MADCTQGVEVRRTWSEREMVRSFGGQISPGTPDGMFESWDGTLTCVQVVRVPLTTELSLEGVQETLRHPAHSNTYSYDVKKKYFFSTFFFSGLLFLQ